MLEFFIMSLALTGKKKDHAEAFYDKLISILIDKKIPFMIGGTFAFNEYTGLERSTGDIDIRTTHEDFPTLLKTLNKAGYKTEVADVKWLAKVHDENGFYTDIIYAEMNGLDKVERGWFKYTRKGMVLGHPVDLEPVEELIKSKCYIENRDRDDSGDVVHLILRQGKTLDWKLLMNKMEPHWELLMTKILLFLFIYPSERGVIPEWLIKHLMENLKERFAHPPTTQKITRGLLLSKDYQVGVSQWGFMPITELK